MHDLSCRNTLRLHAEAERVEFIESESALVPLLRTNQQKWLILSGGSNCVLPPVIHQPVLIPALKGICVLQEESDQVLIEVAAGENWNDLVWYCLRQHWYGLENLVAIPGWCGAAPVQNIGAYGVELKDFLHSVRIVSLVDGHREVRSAHDCQLAYRDSIFKNEECDTWLITAIRLRLWRSPHLQLMYVDIQHELEAMCCAEPKPTDVARAVQSIRQRKLPDPDTLANAGSFFKNPWITPEHSIVLQQRFPDLVCYRQNNLQVKLSAAWLIERCGLKGQQHDGVGCHEHHALVLVNYRKMLNQQQHILNWARYVQDQVWNQFNVQLEIEPRIYTQET